MSHNNKLWEHFEKGREDRVKCKTCGILLKGYRTNNLKQHLQRIHKINLSQDHSSFDLPTSLSACSSTSTSQTRINSRTKYVRVKINKLALFKAYVGLVTEDGIAFNALNSKNFKAIVDPICEGLTESAGKKFCLNSSNCKEAVKIVAGNIRKSIALEVKERLISLKIDSATRLSRTVFGVSAQFIAENTIQSRLIGMMHLKGPLASSSKNLATYILKILDTYNISLTQILSITSDNGANMIKTSKLLSQIGSLEEDLDGEESNEVYLTNLHSFENFSESDLVLGTIQHCRCAAHTAQLCALDIAKENHIKEYLLQCRNFTKFIRKSSNGYRDLFEVKGLPVPSLDCATRWGSTYKMISDLNKAKSVLQNVHSVKNKSEDDNFDVNENLWRFIEAYCIIFAPLQKTITKFQEEQLNYSDFYATWLKCKLIIKQILDSETLKECQNYFIVTIGQQLVSSFDKREIKLLDNDGLNACLYLDPRFQHILSISQRSKAVNFLCKLWEQLKQVKPGISQLPTSGNDLGCTKILQSEEHDEEQMLLNFLINGKNCSSLPEDSLDFRTKIEHLSLYFSETNINILQYWNSRKFSDPELYAVSTVCYAIPPTQVSVERAFSALKLILSDLRNRMNHEILEDILLVKLNPQFLNAAVESISLFENDGDE